MGTTVYVDLFFMINFSMDFLCLYLTAKLLSRKMPLWRGLAAAALGGAYAIAALFLPFGRGISFMIDAFACSLLCFVAFFCAREARRILLYILVYTAVSMALGGAMTALFNLFNRSGLFDGIKQSDGDGISVWLFAILAIVSAAITLLGGKFFTKRMSVCEAELEITYNGKSVIIKGMTDSGNLLRDPISGRPCVVVQTSALSPILPARIRNIAGSRGLSGIDELPAELRRRLVIIPASTALGGGMLLGIRADKVSLTVKGKSREADALVVLSELSGTEGGTNALIPSCLMV